MFLDHGMNLLIVLYNLSVKLVTLDQHFFEPGPIDKTSVPLLVAMVICQALQLPEGTTAPARKPVEGDRVHSKVEPEDAPLRVRLRDNLFDFLGVPPLFPLASGDCPSNQLVSVFNMNPVVVCPQRFVQRK